MSFTCGICGIGFNFEKDLQAHLEKHSPKSSINPLSSGIVVKQ
ncbi:hypothetical protein HYX08_02200 [Candidatus Woesearchaeota archaeon]|nr:hypothetical protein [Candidatus Woesearchaeota archaeon]